MWSAGHIKRLVAKGMPEAQARAQVDHWLDRQELTDDFPVAVRRSEVVRNDRRRRARQPQQVRRQDPSRSDRGPAYGRGKAILYQRKNGSLFVNSFAHGGARYELRTAPIELRVGETEQVVNEIERRLVASNRGLYQRGGVIVCTGSAKMPTSDGGEVVTQIIDSRGDYALVEDAEAVAKFIKFDAKGEAASVPAADVAHPHAQGPRASAALPVLVGIVNCPSISADGQLLDQPGYDPKTGVLFDPLGVDFPGVPDRRTGARPRTALERASSACSKPSTSSATTTAPSPCR